LSIINTEGRFVLGLVGLVSRAFVLSIKKTVKSVYPSLTNKKWESPWWYLSSDTVLGSK